MALFLLFGALAVVSGLAMVLSRDGVNAAMLMMVSFASTAALFVLLEAYFLAALQLLVYAGAIVVLFLFIIMLLNVKEGRIPAQKPWGLFVSFFSAALLLSGVAWLFMYFQHSGAVIGVEGPAPAESTVQAFSTAPKHFGYLLFSKYLLPMQCAGFLLLTAMVGVIHLRQKTTQRPLF